MALAQLPRDDVPGFAGRDDEMAVLAGLLDPAERAIVVVSSGRAGRGGQDNPGRQGGHAAGGGSWSGGGVLFIDLHGYNEAPVEPGRR